VENTSSKENKIAEIKLHVPRDKYVIKKQCKSFEEAVDSACNSLERKLKKRKEKNSRYCFYIYIHNILNCTVK